MSDDGKEAGHVGIFWFYRDDIVADSVHHSNGEEYGDFVNGLSDHCTYWTTIQKQVPALRRYEYEQVPRGRVIYDKRNSRFTVLGNERLMQDKRQQALVLERFELQRERARFLIDEHYGRVPGMLEET